VRAKDLKFRGDSRVKHPLWPELRGLADRIAGELMADLKSGKLLKVGIGEVRAAILAVDVEGFDAHTREQLETLTLRRVIHLVG